jgi:hypothetical protein
VLAVALGCVPGGLAALPQVEARPELQGRVSRSGEVFPGAEVVLHRVSITVAGEIDTVRADPQGLFRFQLPSVPREDQEGDIYFAAVRHEGILYFGRAISQAIQLDSLYSIETFDTLTAPLGGAPIPVAVRYVIAEQGPTGWQITDLFELSNEGNRTLVAAPEGGITWQHPLPASARGATVGGGDVSPDAATVLDGRLELTGPIPPGQRQFVLRYEVDALDGLDIPLAAGTGTVEFLVREPAPLLDIEGLPGVETVEMQPGVTFRRYAGDAPASGVVRLRAGEPPAELPVKELSVVLALLLAGVGVFAVYRAGDRDPAIAPAPGPQVPLGVEDARRMLVLEVARIDVRLGDPSLLDDDRSRLAARRAELVAQLSARV